MVKIILVRVTFIPLGYIFLAFKMPYIFFIKPEYDAIENKIGVAQYYDNICFMSTIDLSLTY